jgi:3-oxoacyl-[acyl-carrier protein] reductase
MQRFDGRVAIVTGASRGIGLAIAQRLVAEGARVCVTARKDGPLAEAAGLIGPADDVVAVAGAADDPDHQNEVMARTLERFGRIDVLVNNVGINPAYGPLMELDLGAARKTVEVNLVGTLAWVQAAHAAWMGAAGGSIVNVASVAGLRPADGIGFYGATKAALLHLTQQLALELAPRVRVNAVAPAVVKTRFAGALYEGHEAEVAGNYPLGRLGVPEDIVGAVSYLASDEAAWVTGQVIVLDGGLTLGGGV